MRKSTRIFLILLVLLVVVIAALAVYVKEGLPNVGAPPDLHVEVTGARVQRGQYLANNVAACMSCHSNLNTGFYANPVKAGTLGMGGEAFDRSEGFPGNIYAPNLTPYHLGQWSDGELFRAITMGVSKDGHALFPLMNYRAYGRLDQEDIYSIIAYLRTLPALKNDVPETYLDFPVNFIVNTIPARPELVPPPDSNDAVAEGRYLCRMAGCIECHSRTDKGKIITGTEFGGGREFIMNGKPIYSANITSDVQTGIGSWSKELFIRKFKQYADSANAMRPVKAGEVNTPMPWASYAGMREKDLAAIYAFLEALKPLHYEVKKPGQQ